MSRYMRSSYQPLYAYVPGEQPRDYIRVTIGTPQQMEVFLDAVAPIIDAYR